MHTLSSQPRIASETGIPSDILGYDNALAIEKVREPLISDRASRQYDVP